MELPTVVDTWLWGAFISTVIILLGLDLFVFNRGSRETKINEAMAWSGFWITLAMIFTAWFSFRYGSALGVQFLTGYLVELSLSVDNLFVILLIFKAFKIPSRYQHRVLFWGILGAIVFRGFLIIVGVDLINKFHWIMYIFGAILIYSGLKFLFESDEQKDVTEHWSVRLFKRLIPMTPKIEGEKFLVKVEGKMHATPLLLTLTVIEITDIIFAVDSIPAVLAVTSDAFVAFGSNILALLGLRSLYFVLADWVGKFRYLKPGLSAILCFVGVKMLISEFYKIPSWVSLTVIVMILITAGLTSWYVNRKSVFGNTKGH